MYFSGFMYSIGIGRPVGLDYNVDAVLICSFAYVDYIQNWCRL